MMKIFVAILVPFLLFITTSCSTKCTEEKQKFEKSSYFKYMLSLSSSDTPSAYGEIQTTLSEINETGFIHANEYEYYIIAYSHGILFDGRAFVIKKDKLGTHIIFKSGTAKQGRDTRTERCREDIFTLFKSKEISATLSSDTPFINVKNEIEGLIKNIKPIDQDVLHDETSEIFYYNGKDYYYLSNYNLVLEDYYKINQLLYAIKNTNPFLCLRSSDPAYKIDNQDSIFDAKIKSR